MTEKNGNEIAEIWELFRETDRRMKETDRFLKETSRENREGQREIRERQRETDQQIKEIDKQMGGLGNKFGGLTEGLAYPSMERILMEQFKMQYVAPGIKARRNGDTLELDILAYAGDDINEVYVVEIKSKLCERELKNALRHLKRFREFYPEHKDKALYGIIVAVDVSAEMKQRVLDEGLYLALIADDTFGIQVPKGFQPKRFS